MADRRYLLGIDSGGTSSKAVLFDVEGREIASAKQNTKMSFPAPGHTERDMDALYDSICEVIRETVARV